MVEESDSFAWLSERSALLGLAVLSCLLALFVILPYLQYVLLAIVFAYVLTRPQRWLERYVGATTAALSLILLTVFVVLLPIAYVLAIAIQEGVELAVAIQEGDVGVAALETRLEDVGSAVDLGELAETYEDPILSAVQGVATGAIEIVGGIPGVLIGLTVSMFVLFSLLRDGDRFVSWLVTVVPIRNEVQRELIMEFDRLMWASVVGNVAVAIVQALLLGLGLLVLGIPAVMLLTVLTFLFSLLPLIGAFGVWVPVSIYLVAAGRPLAAAILIGYGMLVSGSDLYLRPALIGRKGALSAATVVLGIFGGIVVFGAVGLFLGPVFLSGAKATLDVYARERRPETPA